jgi:hypothetical protein
MTMQGDNQYRFLSKEMGLPLGDIGFRFFTNDTKEIQQVVTNILNEEREFKKNNDSRFNPDRRDMAEKIMIDILSSLGL